MLVQKPELLFGLPPKPKILLLRYDKIGDVLISVPVFRILKRHFPEAQIDVLLSRDNIGGRTAIEQYVHEVVTFSEQKAKLLPLLLQLRFRQYNVIIDLFDQFSTTSARMVKLLNPHNSVGIALEYLPQYTHVAEPLGRQSRHIVDRTVRVLLPFGIDPEMEKLELEYPLKKEEIAQATELLKNFRTDGKILLGINPAGSHEHRYWGGSNFVDFLNAIGKDFHNVVPLLFTPPGYEAEVQQIALITGAAVAPKSKSFHDFAALLHECDAIFTPDTSVVHLAAAFKKPTVALFSNAARASHGIPWLPYNTPHVALETNNPAISSIAVDSAIFALKKLITTYF
ncbi:MAG TPA: glycosyltransferase family 9 protein [Patescibacteria group bacterium]|nr:glycosyltransferase family 9 protein [Patescibacteria group bacterium]